MQLSKELKMSDVIHRFTGDKRLEFSKRGSHARQSSGETCSAVRNFEAAQRSKILFEDEAEIDLSSDLAEHATLALLLEQRGWDSNYGS
jgi:hypothetical protein